MPSNAKKGNYFRLRTREWLEGLGYEVIVLERTQRIFLTDKLTGQPRVLFQKKDAWGADLCAKNAERMVFIQVKSREKDIAEGMKQLAKGLWPPCVERWVAHWPARRRSAEGPDIAEVPR